MFQAIAEIAKEVASASIEEINISEAVIQDIEQLMAQTNEVESSVGSLSAAERAQQLEANATYIKNGHLFETDESGFIKETSGSVEPETAIESDVSIPDAQQELANNTKPLRYEITRNESLAGDRHPITGVRFERKIVDLPDEQVEGVFPEFESQFDAKIPENMYMESDKVQFRECNKQLWDAIQKDPELKSKFTEEQLEQIRDGIEDGTAPDGYVWHHNEEAGVLQLVDAETHAKTGHTGGRNLWGGGTESR